MVKTSGRTELDAEAVTRLLAAHGPNLAQRGATLIGTADPPRILWANRAAVVLFGSEVADVLDERLFGEQGRRGLAGAVGRLIADGGSRQERLRFKVGLITRSVAVTISRWSGDGGDLLVLTSTGEGGDGLASNALRSVPQDLDHIEDAAPAAAVEAPRQPSTALAAGSERPARSAPDRLTALGAKRFLWQSDAAGRLVRIDEGVTALRHLTDGSLTGRPFVEALLASGVTGADRLAGFMAGQRSFSGVRVTWPLAEPGWDTPVVLGAIPMRGDAGSFAGFRGFGVLDFAKLLARPVSEPPADTASNHPTASPQPVAPIILQIEPSPAATPAVPPEQVKADDAAPTGSVEAPPAERVNPTATDPLDLSTLLTAPAAPPRTAPAEAAPIAPVDVRVSYPSANIVPLRPSRLRVRVAPPPAEMAARPDPEAGFSHPEEVLNLSSSEQSNFDAIARALRTASLTGSGSPKLAPGDAAAMIERLKVAVAVTSGGNTVYANAAFLALTGYESVALLEAAGGWPHLLGGLDVKQVVGLEGDRAFPVVAASGGVVAVEGRRVAVEWRGEPAEMLTLRAATDRMAQVQALEIEARRRAEEAAEARALLDRVEDAVAVLDARGRVLSLNAAARALFGRPHDDAIGESIGAFLSTDGQSAVLGAVFAAGTAGPHADEVMLLAAARRRPAAASPYDIRVKALGEGKVGLVIRDRTADLTLRDEARHLRDELDNAAQTRADFLARVSHQVRTPLNTVIGFAELMLEERFGPVGNPRYLDYLTDIHDAGKQAVGLLGGWVDLSSVADGAQEMTPVATDVNAVVGDSVAELQGQAHRDRVIVRQSLAGNLPLALVDADAMRQVMDNILSNAIQFNEPGGQVIVSTALHESGAVVVRVRDTGIGMSDAEIEIALEPFRRLPPDRMGAGSGLGLPRARALAEANNGTLSIRSRKSEGTLVEVSLRAAPERAEDAPAA